MEEMKNRNEFLLDKNGAVLYILYKLVDCLFMKDNVYNAL